MDCWSDYEKSLAEIKLPWKQGEPLTIPAKKTKIYAYLEVLSNIQITKRKDKGTLQRVHEQESLEP